MKKPRTALLLVDYINLFDFDQAAKLAPRAVRAAVCTARVKLRAKQKAMPCIYANDNFGKWTSEFSALADVCARKKGAAGIIARVLQPAKDDLSILKPRHSAFYGTPLEFLLDELKVSRLIVTGLATDICVFATAQDAYMRKFKLWVPSNCVATFTPGREKSALAHMARTLKARTDAASRTNALVWK